MMRKAIIIDDKKNRQDRFIGEDAVKKLSSINGVFFSYDLKHPQAYDSYDLIAVHRSLLVDNKVLATFIEYCKNRKKYLVTFSGNVTKDTYNSDSYIELNSKTFYHFGRLYEFLCSFCEKDEEVHLLRLVYGTNWKLPFLVEYNHLKWQYGDAMPDKIQERLFDLEDIIGSQFANDDKRRNQEIENLKNQM